jgi:CHAT domain-containing protein
MSSLLLGANGDADDFHTAISALEISAWSVNQRLVVLSACESGVGPVSATEGPVSLAQAFLEARAREVIATLWRVPDVAAARFSKAFYTALASGNGSSIDAVRTAQVGMLREGRWRDPHFWAGFTLTVAPGENLQSVSRADSGLSRH